MGDQAPLDTDVALIGYGPTGEVFANLLGARGWRVDAFERALDVFHQPRAVHFDAEIMRVFQQIGVADAISEAITPVRGMHFLNGAGELIFRFDADDGAGPLGWPQGFMFYQPDLERALRAGTARYASVTAHLGHEVHGVQPAADGTGAVVEVGGPEGRRSVRARFAVGCCGARSITRAAIGSSLFDYGFEQPWLVLDVILRRDVGLPRLTMQYCDPERPSTYVVMPGLRRRFELMLVPGDTADEMLNPSRIAALLARWIQPGDYDVDRAAIYSFHCLIAERWRRGPLLIAGDAVHQMPPFLGQGMCAGVRDAANLAWKLDLVLRGVANDSLLDTYQDEREAHVRRIVETDMYLGGIIQTTNPEVARQRDAKAAESGEATVLTPSFYPLGGSLCGAGAGARLPFPQPLLADGRRHDDLLGTGFAVVGPLTPSTAAQRVLDRIGTTIIANPVPVVADWLAALEATGALVRPDRIVLALLRDAADLDGALIPLAAHLVG